MAIPHLQHLPLNKRAKVVLSMGLQPKRWKALSRRQKKLIRRIIGGTPINEALKKYKVSPTTYYRWLNGHRLFREYFKRQAMHASETVETRLDANLLRAVRVVEDTMSGKDPYMAYNAAEKLLSGRGRYRKSTDVQKDVRGSIDIHKSVENTHQMDPGMTQMFINALLGQSKGLQAPAPSPRIIDAEVLKSLPAPQGSSVEV
jgi:hypothetical protein